LADTFTPLSRSFAHPDIPHLPSAIVIPKS